MLKETQILNIDKANVYNSGTLLPFWIIPTAFWLSVKNETKLFDSKCLKLSTDHKISQATLFSLC